MSARKWASPRKSAKKSTQELNTEEYPTLDLSKINVDLGNKSWADIVTESEDNATPNKEKDGEAGRRRKAAPKKADPKPRFARALELGESTTKNERLKRLENEKRRAEQGDSSEGRQLRKRKISTSSVAAQDLDEQASPRKRANIRSVPRKTARCDEEPSSNSSTPAKGRRRLCSSVSSSPSIKKREDWEEPTLGWCEDEEVLKRRSREIERAKDKPVYERYLQEIPKNDRVKGIHPRTPNKLINYSRRSWDSLIRRWKRALYEWAGEEPTDSTRTSRCSSRASSIVDLTDPELTKEKENEPSQSLSDVKVVVRPEADAMASLLGHFEMDSRRGIEEDESTLKAPSTNAPVSGPVDFSSFQ
ncbi:hypothetical protein QR680_000983 [Steinernema hermaphroditum]|uniref:Histone RNA hairpin-binding protein RNA-binding domain-containing protein n=1 Tax=Steinernema hermaphroditum TaxID=289476 RepID=A0AA39LF19_9BILA|nr:hypothetical protein QR680_000983 [Steinernema hermaphroditum]